jgi:hypothetical protein
MSKALLIVHGIGEQLRGQTTEKLVSGLDAAFGQRLTVTREASGHAVAVTVGGMTVHFHEVFWADLLTRETNRGALTWATMPTLVWHPLLCRRTKLLPGAEYPTPLVLAWLALTLPASLLAYPMALGARALVQPFDEERQKRLRERVNNMRFLERVKATADAAAHDDTILEATFEGVVADVPNYMSSAARGEGVAFEVLARFHDVMRVAGERHDDVYILAHSLGTVVAYHALTGMGQPAGVPPYAPRRLFTIGSPLEKIRFFWPWTVRCTSPSAHPEFRWTNFYHRMDAVSGSLRRFAAWAPLENVRLKGGGGFLRSHVVYERSPEFLGMLTEELFGERTIPRVAWWRRLLDHAITLGENLAAPVGLMLSLVMGVALLLILVLGFPHLMAAGLRVIVGDVWAGRVANGLSLIVLLTMTVFVVRGVRKCYLDAGACVTGGASAAAASASIVAGEQRASASGDSRPAGV